MAGKVIIEHLDIVGIWTYDVPNQQCYICKSNLTDPCSFCSNEAKDVINENCKISMGKCRHAYHYHCIEEWRKTNDICPRDRNPWIYDKENIDSFRPRLLNTRRKKLPIKKPTS